MTYFKISQMGTRYLNFTKNTWNRNTLNKVEYHLKILKI